MDIEQESTDENRENIESLTARLEFSKNGTGEIAFVTVNDDSTDEDIKKTFLDIAHSAGLQTEEVSFWDDGAYDRTSDSQQDWAVKRASFLNQKDLRLRVFYGYDRVVSDENPQPSDHPRRDRQRRILRGAAAVGPYY
jgi:hypothetical protein